MLNIGTLLQDRYRIENVLGQGGMGSVYLATHVHLQREVAIKQLYVRTRDAELDAAALRQFKHEAMLLQGLSHPRLPQVIDYIEVDDCPYLIMEYVRGRSLGSILESGVRQSEVMVRNWALALCEVLTYLHTRNPPIIFRDMKPSNVMLDTQGQIKLIDFGIAKIFDPSSITKTFAKGAGSPGYSSPEQYSGTTGVRSDIYSLGATLYALLAGKIPPPSVELAAGVATLRTLQELRPDVDRRFSDAIHWCMQIRSSDRPASVEEAALAMQQRTVTVPQAQPNPQGFATPDVKAEATPTSMADTGPTDTERLKHEMYKPVTKKRRPPPPEFMPSGVAPAAAPPVPPTPVPKAPLAPAQPVQEEESTNWKAVVVIGIVAILLAALLYRLVFGGQASDVAPAPPAPLVAQWSVPHGKAPVSHARAVISR